MSSVRGLNNMTINLVSSEVAILDLLRKNDWMSVSQMTAVIQVTGTAVRQRLSHLMKVGYVERCSHKSGRGRPSHRYSLTAKGRRKTGANFADLAVALWNEIREIEDSEVRRGLLKRIARRMVDIYSEQIEGETMVDKMNSLSRLFDDRNIPISVDVTGEFPTLNVLACPYPDLVEQDRAVCAMERMMFADLLGQNVRLDKCRLDEGTCCTFGLN